MKSARLPVLLLLVWSVPALAHWCHDLWGSSYNIVVKPATDTVNVPAGGNATLDVFVQNNMGYPLINFALRATATGFTIGISRQAPRVANFLMPGENLRHTLTISSTAGGTLSMANLNFYVDFGEGTQDMEYGGGTTGSTHVVMRKNDGTLKPARPVTIPSAWDQALHLGASAKADFSDLAGGLDDLMREFCAGRGSWDTNGGASNTANCSGTSTTCPAAVSRSHTKYDYQHLWASGELGYRKSALGTRVSALRARLMCATNDSSPSFKWFPFAVLGYLGEDATARTWLTNLITSGSADEKAAAKSALLLFGNAADRTAYRADVVSAMSVSNEYVQMLAATSLGIVDSDDSAVSTELLPRALWVEPDTSDNGKAMFAAHLVNLVAWSRRGWATDAAYTGNVSFYGTGPTDTTPPRPPQSVACATTTSGTVRISWAAVTQDTAGGTETLQTYKVYSGVTARPANATRPGEQGFDYDHLDPTTSLYFDFPSLSGTQTHYFTVTAVDTANNASVYSTQISCIPAYPPVARVTCTPTSGSTPLAVSCDSSTSTDPNGTADITTREWRLDGQAQPNGTTMSTSLATAGAHVVTLTITDSTARTSTAQATVTASTAGNTPPTARATATPTSGAVPLTVQLSSSGSSDPDTGQTLTYKWDFGDSTATSTQANPSHTFSIVGYFNVMLSVTDSAPTPATSYAQVRVTVSGNSPPDVASVSASPGSGNAPLDVRFDASGVTDPDGNTISYRWDFGDSSGTATTAVANHRYTTPGSYTARLTVTDDGVPALSAPVTVNLSITVRPPGAVNQPPDCSAAKVTPASGSAPLEVTLDGSGCIDPDGDRLIFSWRVPRTITTEDVFPTATATTTLATPGPHTVTLYVRDDNSSPLEITRDFTVTVAEANDMVVGSCGCHGGGLELMGLLALLALRRRERC